MEELSRSDMFSTSAPSTWRGVLTPVADLEQLLRDEEMSLSQKRKAAVSVREALHAEADRLISGDPEHHDTLTESHRRAFSEAVMLASYFPRSVGGIRLDTLRSKSLVRFPVDMDGTDDERKILFAALREAFAWPQAAIDAMHGKVSYLTAGLRLKRAITEILSKNLQADTLQDDLDGAIRRLFQSVYGEVPFRPGDIGITVTEGSVNFGIWFKDAAVTRDGYEMRTDEERSKIHAFLTSVRKSAWRTDRFPGFGHFDVGSLSEALVAKVTDALHDLSAYSDVTREVVFQTLCTMFTCFSAHESEQYLIHDTWGHCWQQSLCEFEWGYYELAFVREDLSPDTGVRFAKRSPDQALASAFEVHGCVVQLNRDRAREIIEAEIRGRIAVCVNAIVAEMLADLVEHKFIRYAGRYGELMKSSSVFRDQPLKLDLTYQDINFHLRFWRRPFRRIVRQAESRLRLAQQLRDAGLPETGLLQSVEALAEVVGEFDPVAFRCGQSVKTAGDGRIAIDIPRRLFLAALLFDRAVTAYLDNGDAAYRAACEKVPGTHRWQCPPSSVDLLLVSIGWMYEHDRERSFWQLGEVVRHQLTPMMLQFQKGLDRVLSRTSS